MVFIFLYALKLNFLLALFPLQCLYCNILVSLSTFQPLSSKLKNVLVNSLPVYLAYNHAAKKLTKRRNLIRAVEYASVSP
jgi:hypothetical protein